MVSSHGTLSSIDGREFHQSFFNKAGYFQKVTFHSLSLILLHFSYSQLILSYIIINSAVLPTVFSDFWIPLLIPKYISPVTMDHNSLNQKTPDSDSCPEIQLSPFVIHVQKQRAEGPWECKVRRKAEPEIGGPKIPRQILFTFRSLPGTIKLFSLPIILYCYRQIKAITSNFLGMLFNNNYFI